MEYQLVAAAAISLHPRKGPGLGAGSYQLGAMCLASTGSGTVPCVCGHG